MKKQWIFLVVLFCRVHLSLAQELISEDFSGNVFPPAEWTLSAHEENWKLSQRNIAGDEPPEAQLYFQPLFNDTARLISPAIPLAEGEDIRIEFRHAIEHHYPEYTIGLALLKDKEWQSIWDMQPDTNISNTRISLLLDYTVVTDSLQLSWYFIGYVFNMYSWFIDDIRVYHPYDRDVAAVFVKTEKQQHNAGESVNIHGKIMNPGQTDAMPCEYSLTIKLDDKVVFSETFAQNIPAGESFEFEVNDFIPAEEYCIYDIILIADIPDDQYISNDTTRASFNTYATARQQVLAEMATGTWCGTCPGAALGLDELLLNDKSVAAIGYHVLDNFENPASLYRLGYYFIPAYPTVYFDGKTHFTGGHQFLSLYDDYFPIYQDKISVNAPAALLIFGEHEGNDYDITLEVNMHAKIRSEYLRVFLVLTESHIPEAWGGGGMEEVNHAARQMIPDHFGLPLEGEPGNYNFELTFSLDEDWIGENCELIAFIQDTLSFKVFQAEKKTLPELTPAGSDQSLAEIALNLYPNPAKDLVHIRLPEGPKIHSIELFNIEGQMVTAWYSVKNHEFALQLFDNKGSKFPAGVYLLNLVYDKGVCRKKLILQ